MADPLVAGTGDDICGDTFSGFKVAYGEGTSVFALASARAVSTPIPDAQPVTMARRPTRSIPR